MAHQLPELSEPSLRKVFTQQMDHPVEFTHWEPGHTMQNIFKHDPDRAWQSSQATVGTSVGKEEEHRIHAKREESSFSHPSSHLDSSVRKGASHTLFNKGIQKKKRDAVTPKNGWCGVAEWSGVG